MKISIKSMQVKRDEFAHIGKLQNIIRQKITFFGKDQLK
jgi:hypothetical protein